VELVKNLVKEDGDVSLWVGRWPARRLKGVLRSALYDCFLQSEAVAHAVDAARSHTPHA
jgi:hypothetical protein